LRGRTARAGRLRQSDHGDGPCAGVTVRGKMKKLTFDSADSLTVSGTNNKVFSQHDSGKIRNRCKGADCQVEAIHESASA